MALDYGYQHNAHVVDWRMVTWMKDNPRPPHIEPSQGQRDYERNWGNYQSQTYYGWIKLP